MPRVSKKKSASRKPVRKSRKPVRKSRKPVRKPVRKSRKPKRKVVSKKQKGGLFGIRSKKTLAVPLKLTKFQQMKLKRGVKTSTFQDRSAKKAKKSKKVKKVKKKKVIRLE